MWIAYVASRAPESGAGGWRSVILQPQVRCGSVYVSADDTARRVTQTAVACTGVAEKKRRAGRYTVAVGTSHGHVQAFLDDSDNVLGALEQCQAEKKCLMLIKRPKESARKMLKSQSLSQMSVSDPQLYRQFNGLQLAQVHQHAQTVSPTQQDDHLETQSVVSNSTDGTDPLRRYLSIKDRQTQHGALGARRPSDCHRSDSSNAAPDYQYLPRRDRDCSRRDLRYSSIPEDEDQEINNNSKGSSHHGSPLLARPASDSSREHIRHDQSPSRACQNRPTQRPSQQGWCQSYEHFRSDQTLGVQSVGSPQMPRTRNAGDMEVDARSLSSLPAGLTFSVVGQRKADSFCDGPSSSTPIQPHPTSCAQQGRQPQGQGDRYWETTRSPDRVVKSRNSYPTNGSPRSCEGDPMAAPCRSSGQYDSVHFSPRHLQRHHLSNDHHHDHPGNRTDVHRSPRHYPSNGDHQDHPGTRTDVEALRGSQYNGHVYNRSSSSVARELPQTVLAPAKSTGSVPHGSVNETSERLKRFTEFMRSRMSASSCGDLSTTSSTLSHTSTTPHTPPSRQSSLTDNSEVSTLLEVHLGDGNSSPSHQPSSEASEDLRIKHPPQDVRGKAPACGSGRDKQHLTCPNKLANPCPLCGDQQSDCGQTSFTSHSHSSTMDSGYTTNTEGEGDSSMNNCQLSPPHHPFYAHPTQTPHVHTEPYRPVPMPRNLLPTSSRKYTTSMHNGSGTQHPHPPPALAQHVGVKSSIKHSPSSQRKDPASQDAQAGGNHVDQTQVMDSQRVVWDSANGFKSLDFSPVTAEQVDPPAPAVDDLVVKPRVVSVGNGREEPASPHSTDKPDSRSGQDGGSSLSEPTGSSSLPPQPLESSSVITVPGHWNYNNTNNGNILNNNDTTNGGVFHSSPRSHPKPQVKPTPTLFQLAQCYDLCSVRLATPAALSASSLVTLTTVQVTLPALNVDNGSVPSQSPQGQCARIGGPGSAFRPVRTATTQTMELTAVDSTDEQCRQHVTVGELHPGDLLLEMNGWQCIGHDLASIRALLETTQGETALVVARKREDPVDNQVQQLECSVHKLEQEVERLTEDLSTKDARIQELSAMLPWRQDDQTGETTLILQSDEGAFVIGENEFVV